MARIEINNLSLTYPAIKHGSSLRNEIMQGIIGGILAREKNQSLIQINAINDLSFNFEDGDRVGLIGHNGAGKTTLLKAIAGIYQPSSGSIKIEGSVGTLFDHGLGIDPEETGRENILFYLRLSCPGVTDFRLMEQEVADFTELGEFLDLPVRTYSAGMKIRLTFGLATVISSSILLMDEVIGAGDAGFYKKAEQRLKKISDAARIIILATHSLDLIREWCNRVIWMEKGTIKLSGTTDEVVSEYVKQHGIERL